MIAVATSTKWWLVVLPGEAIEDSEGYGPFRSEVLARAVADAWNHEHPNDQALVWPIRPATEMVQ